MNKLNATYSIIIGRFTFCNICNFAISVFSVKKNIIILAMSKNFLLVYEKRYNPNFYIVTKSLTSTLFNLSVKL